MTDDTLTTTAEVPQPPAVLPRHTDHATTICTCYRPSDKVPDAAMMAAELAALDVNFGGYEYTNNRIVFTTDPVTLTDTDDAITIVFGRFRIEISIADVYVNPDNRASISARNYISPLDPCKHHTKSLYHPHVHGGTLCFGNAENPARLALGTGRFSVLADICYDLLHSYNPHADFIRLRHWSPDFSTCCGCAVSRRKTLILTCGACGYSYCSGCMNRCEKCKTYTNCYSCCRFVKPAVRCFFKDEEGMGCYQTYPRLTCENCMQYVRIATTVVRACRSCTSRLTAHNPDDVLCEDKP